MVYLSEVFVVSLVMSRPLAEDSLLLGEAKLLVAGPLLPLLVADWSDGSSAIFGMLFVKHTMD